MPHFGLHSAWNHAANRLHEYCTVTCLCSSDGAPGKGAPVIDKSAIAAAIGPVKVAQSEHAKFKRTRLCCARRGASAGTWCGPTVLAGSS